MKTLLILLIGGLFLTTFTQSSLPRGIRNNNPGNIRRTNDRWQGMEEKQTDPEFVQFRHPRYGFRAMARILHNYQRRGLTTLRDIISTWAPKNENDTNAYLNFVAKRLNTSPDSDIDISTRMVELIKAITIFENGKIATVYYSDAAIESGILLA